MNTTKLISALLAGEVTYLESKAADAIEALQAWVLELQDRLDCDRAILDARTKSMNTALAKLRELDRQEPVGWVTMGQIRFTAPTCDHETYQPVFARPVPAAPTGDQQVNNAIKLVIEALSAMLTHMGMDEDRWNKPTFDHARAALAALQATPPAKTLSDAEIDALWANEYLTIPQFMVRRKVARTIERALKGAA